MKNTFIVALFSLVSATAVAQTDYTQYVDPFVGTQGTGHTFPGACVPFGMIQTSPVTGAVGWDYCSEYIYTDNGICFCL